MKKQFSRFRNADPRCKSIRSIPPRTAASYADTSNSPQINCIVFQDKRLQTFTIRSGTGEISIDPVSKCNTPRFPGIFLNPASPVNHSPIIFYVHRNFERQNVTFFFSSPPSSIIHELFKKKILKISDRIDFISRIYTLSCTQYFRILFWREIRDFNSGFRNFEEISLERGRKRDTGSRVKAWSN